MRWTKLFKPAGAIATTACAVVTGIAVNLSILSSGPDGAGNLALNAHRATTTSAPVTQTTRAKHDSAPTSVVIHVAPVPQAIAVTVPDTTSGTAAQPLNGGNGSTTTPSTTNPAPVTTTTVPTPPTRTFSVGRAGSVVAQWVDSDTVVVTAHPARGWKVHVRERDNLIEARFDRDSTRIVWRALIVNHSLKVDVRHYGSPLGTSDTTAPSDTTETTRP